MTFEVTNTQVALPVGIPLFAGLANPLHCFVVILCYAVTIEVTNTQIIE